MRGARPLRSLPMFLIAAPVVALIAVAVAQPPPPPPLAPLGNPPVPPGNPITEAKRLLGMALFWDEQLSSTGTVACGTCHRAEAGGIDPRSVTTSARATHPGPDGVRGTADDITGAPGVPLADSRSQYAWSPLFGIGEQVTARNSQSHINAGFAPSLFWDGRARSPFLDPVTGDTVLFANAALESQAAGPPLSAVEMAHTGLDWATLATRVAGVQPLALALDLPDDLDAWIAGRGYPELFAEAFGTPGVTARRIAMAIATYERTLTANQTPFDSVLAGTAVLTPQENAGRQLFGQLPCAGCHAGGLMSDNVFHYIGVRPAAEDSGRARVTGLVQDLGRMRTPSLRNAALRPAFFHNGRFSTLQQVVAFYNRGGDFNAPNKAPGIVPLNLTVQQQQNLVAFLSRPLIDRRVAERSGPFVQPFLYGESDLVPEVIGSGVAGAAGVPEVIALEPPMAGNDDFTVGVHSAAPGAAAVLVLDAVEPSATGGIPATASFARLETTVSADGHASVSTAIAADPSLHGVVLYGRWYVEDGAAPGAVASSPSFRFKVFGPRGAGVLSAGGAVPGLPRALRLHATRPSPFRGSTQITFDLFALTPVRLVLFDAQGRAVRRLVDAPLMAPGTHFAEWDGRDDAGRVLPGGVYFYRLEAGASSQTMRAVKVQ